MTAVQAINKLNKQLTFHNRIQRAIEIIYEQGGVILIDQDTAIVKSQAHSRLTYHVQGRACPCESAEYSLGGLCKHILAVYLYRQVQGE